MADSLLKEVDQAMRADRAAALWAKHRQTVIMCVVALILGTAANSAWQYIRETRGAEKMLAFSESQKLLVAGKPADAAKAFAAIADDSRGELHDLARIWQARALSTQGKKPEAISALKQAVAGDSVWADIACLRLAGLDSKESSCLSAQKNSPLATTRAEWDAANMWAKGDSKAAIASIEAQIADKDTSDAARDRLTQWLAGMKAQAKDAK